MGRREETSRRWGRGPRWTPSQWWIFSVACRTVKRLRNSGKKGGNRQTVREEAHVNTITMMKMFCCLQYVKEIKECWGRREERGRRWVRRPRWTPSQWWICSVACRKVKRLRNSGEEGRKQADGEGGGPGRHHHNDEYVQLPAEK